MTPSAYIQQVKDHRRRMSALGQAYANKYWLYAAAATRTACTVHDIEKWLFLPLLYAFHGGRGNRKTARFIYDVMNVAGAVVSAVVLIRYPAEDRAQARKMERVFDCLDRSLDPVARTELGDKEDPPPLSKFLSEIDLVIAQSWVEQWKQMFAAK